MPRYERAQHPHAFADQGDFNEQLYLALKQAPWWMISIAIHVLLLLVLSIFYDGSGRGKLEKDFSLQAADQMEQDPEETPEETEEIKEQEVVAEEPVLHEREIADHVETDNDLPHEESLGEDGLSDSPFTGPSTNGLIGLGGGAGGAFKGRGGSRNLTTGGGGKKMQNAVMDALKWLAAHQSPDGGWEAAGFDKWCDGKPQATGPDGLGKALFDPGVTGLALCAFLGAGYTTRGEDNPFKRTVSSGLRYLKNVQDAEGCFGPRTSQQYIYNHATAALAMVEAYGMTGSSIWQGPAQKALDFIALARNPYFAWRYGVKPGDNDTSVTGWMMMALKSAKLINEDAVKQNKRAPLVLDESAFDGIKAWVEKVTDPDYGRVGYLTRGTGPARSQDLMDRFPAEKSEAMTGAGMLARIFIGEDPKTSAIIKKGADLCAKLPPTWNPNDGSIDMYYWYYATLAMFQVGGSHWNTWNKGLETAVVENQRKDTDYCMYKGSWDPIDPWGSEGGRVYSTAVLAMCLMVFYRYDKVFGAN